MRQIRRNLHHFICTRISASLDKDVSLMREPRNFVVKFMDCAGGDENFGGLSATDAINPPHGVQPGAGGNNPTVRRAKTFRKPDAPERDARPCVNTLMCGNNSLSANSRGWRLQWFRTGTVFDCTPKLDTRCPAHDAGAGKMSGRSSCGGMPDISDTTKTRSAGMRSHCETACEVMPRARPTRVGPPAIPIASLKRPMAIGDLVITRDGNGCLQIMQRKKLEKVLASSVSVPYSVSVTTWRQDR